MGTDEDVAEFAQYRRYKYGRSYESSLKLLEGIGKSEREHEPWLKESWALRNKTRPVSRQQEQLGELRGLRQFSSGYLIVPYNDIVKYFQTTSRSPPNPPTSSKPDTSQPTPVMGRMLGLGGTTNSQRSQFQSQTPVRSSTQGNRTRRAQEVRAQAVRTATSTSALDRQEGANQKISPKCCAQKGNRHSHSSRTQNNGVSDSSTASSIHDGSGPGEVLHKHGLTGLGSQFSRVVSVSTPRPVPDDVENVNSKPRDVSAWDVQIGVEIEFLVALEKKTEGERREPGQEFDRYFIPLERQQPTTLINGIPARKYISQVLRDAGIPAVTGHEEVRQATARFIGPLDEYAFWTVKPESSNMVMMPHFAVFDYVGLEFASRKLKTNVQSFQEIREALRLLRRHVLVATSSSCGAHVHVDAATLNLQEREHFLCLPYRALVGTGEGHYDLHLPI